MSQPTTIKRTSIKFTYVAHPHNSPVFEFYERPDHVRCDEEEEEEEGNDSNSDDEVDKEESDQSMVVDSMEEEDTNSSKDKGKGRAVDNPTNGDSSRVKSKLRDNTRDLNGRQPIIILRTGEGWNWSADALTSSFVRDNYECSGSYDEKYPSSIASFERNTGLMSSHQAYQSTKAAEDLIPIDDIFVSQDDWL